MTINWQKETEKMDKKFSFIVPVYKTEKYLKDCLLSLLNQNYKNLEIIVVSDGKSKRAEDIFKKIRKKDKRLVKFVSIQHGGAPKARNEGAKYATGDYLSFWDSDCYASQKMVWMWAKTFIAYPESSYVYSGYRFLDNQHTFINSEPFNKYLMTCYNYVATMFPMKRKVFPGFDESLKSLQDWDLWLTITEKGYEGKYIEGEGFVTEANRKGISSEGCTPEEWLNRYEKVRNKHGIKDRNIAFISISHKYRALELAEEFKQDFLDTSRFHLPNKYKTIYCIGFYAQYMQHMTNAFKTAPSDCNRILHWMGDDVETIYQLPYSMIKPLVASLKAAIHKNYCENEQSRKMLNELGIKADIMPLPMKFKKIPIDKKKFKIYYETDPMTQSMVNEVIKACPDITFENLDMCLLKDYACFLSLTGSIMPSENLKRFCSSGRFVITNYKMMHSGNVSLDRESIIKKIREVKALWKQGKLNRKAQSYYRELINPDRFKRVISRWAK